MAWYVRWRLAYGPANATLCDEASTVVKLYDEQVELGREPWIEDTEGKLITRDSFNA